MPIDTTEAVKWYRKAAEQSYPEAVKALDRIGGATPREVFQSARSEPYRHGPTGIVFPDRIATLEKEARVTDFEAETPGHGVAVGYNGPGITVTVFVYTMGAKAIPEDLQSVILKDHFEQVCGDIVRAGETGHYSNVKKKSDDIASWGTSGSGMKSLLASYSYTQRGQDRLSLLYLMGFRNHFLKVRFTYDKETQEAAEKIQKDFLAEFSRILSGIGEKTHKVATPSDNVYVFAKSGLSVPRQIEALHFVKETDWNSDGSDVSLEYSDPENGLGLSIHVYQSPPDTKGPFLMLDSDGNRMLEDREAVKDPRSAGYKLTQPSENYMEEYRRTLKSISENRGYELKTESRFMAVPKWDNSPIALSAYLAKMDRIEGQDVRMLWKTYLYSIPGYFVKIHCTFPEPLWLEIGSIDVKFIQSINWNELLAKQTGK